MCATSLRGLVVTVRLVRNGIDSPIGRVADGSPGDSRPDPADRPARRLRAPPRPRPAAPRRWAARSVQRCAPARGRWPTEDPADRHPCSGTRPSVRDSCTSGSGVPEPRQVDRSWGEGRRWTGAADPVRQLGALVDDGPELLAVDGLDHRRPTGGPAARGTGRWVRCRGRRRRRSWWRSPRSPTRPARRAPVPDGGTRPSFLRVGTGRGGSATAYDYAIHGQLDLDGRAVPVTPLALRAGRLLVRIRCRHAREERPGAGTHVRDVK